MPMFDLSDIPPYWWKNGNTSKYYEPSRNGFVLVKLPTRKNRVQHMLKNIKSRKSRKTRKTRKSRK
jgi:hypothetical protein